MLQGGVHVGMRAVSLSTQEGFDLLESILDGGEKRDIVQVASQSKSRRAFWLVAAATFSMLQEWSKAILSAIRRT